MDKRVEKAEAEENRDSERERGTQAAYALTHAFRHIANNHLSRLHSIRARVFFIHSLQNIMCCVGFFRAFMCVCAL